MTYPDPQANTTVQFAFGADLTADQDSWSWTDVSATVLAEPISITRGRQDEQGQVEAADCTLVLENIDGRYTPDHPMSQHYPNVVTGTPVRVTVHGSVRFVGQVSSWEPEWPEGDLSDLDGLDELVDDDNQNRGHAIVTVRAAGILQRLQTTASPLRSPIWRATMAVPALWAYWPLEESGDASVAASPLPRVKPAGLFGAGEVEPGAEPVAPGSGPSIRLTAGVTTAGAIRCIPPWSSAAGWVVESCFRVEDDTSDGNIWQMVVRDNEEPNALWITTASLSSSTLTITLAWQPDPDDSGSSVTLDTAAVDRGTFHQVRLFARTAGSARQWALTVDGVEVGSDSVTGSDDPEAVGSVVSIDISAATINVGHVAMYRVPVAPPPLTWRAVEGWAREAALGRFERLCLEEGVRWRHVEPDTVDTFTRTETNAWGSADTGEAWTTHGNVAGFSVAGGVGIIQAPEGIIRAASLPTDRHDVDVRVRVETDFAAGVDLRMNLDSGYGSRSGYAFYADLLGAAAIFRLDGGVDTGLVSTGWDAPVGAVWMRVQAVGSNLRMKIWPDGEPEPNLWLLETSDSTYSSGLVTLWSSESETHFDDLAVTDVPRTPRLGVQQIATLIENLQAAADADGGILLETRSEMGITFRPLSTLYNQDAGMELDAAGGGQGDIVNPLVLVLDDQSAANDVTVERMDGSLARAIDTADVARRGMRDEQLTLNLADDGQLVDQATWRLHLGTWPGMRYPTVAPNLNGRESLYQDWLPMEVGDRQDLQNLPPQHPPNDMPLMLQGYAETIGPNSWEVEANCSPYGPLIVGTRLATSDTPGAVDAVRRDSDSSELASQFITGTDTSMSVTTTGVLWGVTGDANMTFPLDINVGGARLRVTGISGSSSPQTFTVQQTPVNGVVKTLPAGTAVRLWQPATRAL